MFFFLQQRRRRAVGHRRRTATSRLASRTVDNVRRCSTDDRRKGHEVSWVGSAILTHGLQAAWLIKDCVYDIKPFFTKLANVSMACGSKPYPAEEEYITYIIKKPQLDNASISNCMPVSYLSVISRLLETAVSSRLVDYLDNNKLMPPNQSAH